jgi:hypothetical protein
MYYILDLSKNFSALQLLAKILTFVYKVKIILKFFRKKNLISNILILNI